MPPLILVVDDDPTTQGVTRRLLQVAGYTVLTADTAIDALTHLKNGQVPHLAVLDIRLQSLPGPKLALRIHAQHPRIPFLLVSGWAEELRDVDQLAPLRWAFLQKPFTSEALLPVVERLLASGDGSVDH